MTRKWICHHLMYCVRFCFRKKADSIKNSCLMNRKFARCVVLHLKYSFAMSIDNPTAIAESLSHYTWLTGDPESLNRLYAMYDKVTADDLIRVANKYFVNTTLTAATISPSTDAGVK